MRVSSTPLLQKRKIKNSMSEKINLPSKVVDPLLEGITIIDLSHRLPGPYAAMILKSFGARVIKVEDQKFRDPFDIESHDNKKNPFYGDDSFQQWYRELNHQKELVRLDFQNQTDLEKLYQLLDQADAVIMGLPLALREKMKLSTSELKIYGPLVMISMLSSQESQKGMHDLNALAEIGLLDLHLKSQRQKTEDSTLPFLPLAGLSFGHYMATTLLAALLKNQKQKSIIDITCSLKESAELLFSPFYNQKLKEKAHELFLHNGRYPCYQIYWSKNQIPYALAAVEEKFWNAFKDAFHLNVPAQQRLSPITTPEGLEIYKTLKQRFQELESTQIDHMIDQFDMCLSRIQ